MLKIFLLLREARPIPSLIDAEKKTLKYILRPEKILEPLTLNDTFGKKQAISMSWNLKLRHLT